MGGDLGQGWSRCAPHAGSSVRRRQHCQCLRASEYSRPGEGIGGEGERAGRAESERPKRQISDSDGSSVGPHSEGRFQG